MTIAIELRDITEADLPVLFEQQNDPEANWLAAFAARALDAFMVHWAKVLADPDCHKKAILYGGRVAGNIGSFERDGVREVGFWLGREFRGQGIGSAALVAFLDTSRIRPLYARVAQRNRASSRVLEKCGFQLVGEDLFYYAPADERVVEHVYRLDGPTS